MRLLYDVCHNIAKRETHTIGGERREVCVHRKGATRAFGPGHHPAPGNLPENRPTGFDPRGHGAVFLCPGGNRRGHGADLRQHLPRGRPAAEPDPGQKGGQGPVLRQELEDRGIIVRGAGRGTIVEEISEAYKDVASVVEVVHGAGISNKVAQLRPWGVIKG